MTAVARPLACGGYDYAGLNIVPAGPLLGAEISNIDLADSLDGETVAAIHAALLQYKVLFFRDQDISHKAHLAFGRLFGELESHPITAHLPGYPEILHIEAGDGTPLTGQSVPLLRVANKWHADVTFLERPSMGGVLRARKLPPSGGDTLFSDTSAVWRDLPKELQIRLSHLKAEHDILRNFGHRITAEKRGQLARKYPPVAHPVVRTHPETGDKSVFVNHEFTTRILGVDEAESRELLADLIARIAAPEYHVRFHWSPNTVAFWDNRTTQHYPILDYWPHQRVVERVTIRGDRPF